MHKDEIKGKMKDVKGRVERQAGEWTGNKELQGKGIADQAEGKIQKGVGKVKDAGARMARDLRDRAHAEGEGEREREHDRDSDIGGRRKVA